MSFITVTTPDPLGAARAPRRDASRQDMPSRPALVATDGRDVDASVLLTGERVALRLGIPPRALTVVAPLPVYGEPAVALVPVETETARAATLADLVRDQIERETGETWPTDVAVGPVGPTIVETARTREASLIVLGVGRHGAWDRWFGTETALHVLRAAERPVLAVGPDADGVFRRAVVAVDFGVASARAAAIACRLLAPGGILSLVHVKTGPELREPPVHAAGAHGLPYTNALRQRLVAALRHGTTGCEECGAALGRDDVTIGFATLLGDPASELLDYAAHVGADLVAVGMHHGPSARRPNAGRVATEVIRQLSARRPACSMLTCGPPAPPIADRMTRRLSGWGE